MEENNSSEASPNSVVNRKMDDTNSKNCDTLKNDTMQIGDDFSGFHREILLNEASKIFQMGVEKDYAIWEKNKIIKDAMETIENMKKNIYHVQTEYEKLDQNYQKEIYNAAEAQKRIDFTKNMIDSATYYANILAESIKQLDNDKLKIVEFYNEIHTKQEENEEKQKKLEMIIKEHQDFTESKFTKIMSEKIKAEQKLSEFTVNLSETERKLKSAIDKNVYLEGELEKCKDEIKELRSNILSEQTNRIKYQIMQSQLKKRVSLQKAEDEKTLKNEKILNKRKLKLLKFKIKYMKEKLDSSEESTLKHLSTINDLDKKIVHLNEVFQKTRQNYERDIKELEEKLKNCLFEKSNLDNVIQTLNEEKIEENRKITGLTQENMILLSAQETTRLNLQEKENQLDKLLKENLGLGRKVEELILEISSQTQEINKLAAEVQSHNTEDILEKIKTYEEKLLKSDAVEKELRNEIVLLNETMSKECCEKEKVVLENRKIIQQLENKISELQDQKEVAERELKETYTEYSQVRNELTLKSADLENITREFDLKMKMVHNEAELSEKCRMNLDKEKKLNEELLQRVQKLDDEKAALNKELTKALDKEKSLNQNLVKENEDKGRTIKKYLDEIEQGKLARKVYEERLNQANKQIIEMQDVSEKLKSSEETINNLKKSLELTEANAEAYKMLVKKFERESAIKKNVDKETIDKLQSEISKLKQKNENPETPKCGQNRRVKNENESNGSTSKRTPTTSRRLLSTPKRLMQSSLISPNYKCISPIVPTRDPYEFDSDFESEISHTDKVFKQFPIGQKKGIYTSCRKK